MGDEETCAANAPAGPDTPEVRFASGETTATIATRPGQWHRFAAAANQVATVAGPDAAATVHLNWLQPTPTTGTGEVTAILPRAGETDFLACADAEELTLGIDYAASGLTWRPTTIDNPFPDRPDLDFSVSGLEFEGDSPATATEAAAINAWLDTEVARQIDDVLTDAPATDNDERPIPTFLWVDPTVTLVSEQYLSLDLAVSINVGAYPRW